MVSSFWNSKGVIVVDFLQRDQTHWAAVFWSSKAIKGDYQRKPKRRRWDGIFFHQDMAPAHKTQVAVPAAAAWGLKLLHLSRFPLMRNHRIFTCIPNSNRSCEGEILTVMGRHCCCWDIFKTAGWKGLPRWHNKIGASLEQMHWICEWLCWKIRHLISASGFVYNVRPEKFWFVLVSWAYIRKPHFYMKWLLKYIYFIDINKVLMVKYFFLLVVLPVPKMINNDIAEKRYEKRKRRC